MFILIKKSLVKLSLVMFNNISLHYNQQHNHKYNNKQ